MGTGYGVLRSEPWRHKQLQPPVVWDDTGVASPPPETKLSSDGIAELVQQGAARNRLTEFAPVAFSRRLVPAGLTGKGVSAAPLKLRGTNRLYLHKATEAEGFAFTVRGGLIYGDRGPVTLRLFADRHALVDTPVGTATVPVDKKDHAIVMASPYAGLHRLEIADGGDLTNVTWPAGQPVAIPASPAERTRMHGSYSLVFHVPVGTTSISGYCEQPKGSLRSAAGELLFDFSTLKQAGYFSVPLREDLAGQWHRLVDAGGVMLLMTVPPYLARSPDELLLPEEARHRPR